MNDAVIGLQFGDEGKGRVVDYLCSKNHFKYVIRYTGGHQAGHHVVHSDKDHVFSNFGCGTFHNVPTYWSKYCTFEPMSALYEYDILVKDLEVTPVLHVCGECPVTTPYDIAANRILNKKYRHGTCGVGFGTTLQRETDKVNLKVSDISNITVFKIKLDMIAEYYYKKFGHVLNISHSKYDSFVNACNEVLQHIVVSQHIEIFDNVLYEASQGLLLDQDIGFYPYVTRSNTGTKNMNSFLTTFHLVTRAYQTRHGNGPMTNLDISHDIKPNPFEKNKNNNFQGKFRRSLLDLDLLEYALSKEPDICNNNNVFLYITCMDLIQDDRRLTHAGHILEFDNDKQFVYMVAKILNIKLDKVMLSYSAKGEMRRLVDL